MPATRDARRSFRLRPAQDALIQRAARTRGVSVSAFVADSATERAHAVLSDQRDIVVDEVAWSDLVAAMDRPAEVIPAIAAMFTNDTRITRQA